MSAGQASGSLPPARRHEEGTAYRVSWTCARGWVTASRRTSAPPCRMLSTSCWGVRLSHPRFSTQPDREESHLRKDKSPGWVLQGKHYPGRPKQAGIIFYNDDGEECGGLAFGNEGAGLMFDQRDQDQIVGLMYDRALGEVPILHEDIRGQGEDSAEG